MRNRMMRPPQETASSECVGRSTATINPAPSVAPTTVAPRASEPVSRSAATSTSVAPRNASVVGMRASGSRPPTPLAEEARLGRADGVWPEAREDLEAARERSGSAPKRRSRPLVGEVVDAVRHETDLPSRCRGKAYQLRGRRDDELGGLGIRL